MSSNSVDAQDDGGYVRGTMLHMMEISSSDEVLDTEAICDESQMPRHQPSTPARTNSALKGSVRTLSLGNSVLKFENITFVAGKGKKCKTIIENVSAEVTDGHVLAVMGPSGAGKSTLISALTQDAFYGSAFGTVTLNGFPLTDTLFKRYCYVVKQQDTNWPDLSARETLMYAAELYDVTDGTPDLLVDTLLQKTGLVSCADTRIARLSGGQQRRVSLAVALLKQPSVLFLDEPTSGLDAASASNIMREITRVAKEERLIVVCTIHQPSSKVYNGFDQLMILSKGREAFVGRADKASAYFASIGYALPPATNPAEHFLDLVNADFSSAEEVDGILDAWESQHKITSPLLRETDQLVLTGGNFHHRLIRETRVMLRRHALLIVRDPVFYSGRFIGYLVVNCIFGIVYIAARQYVQSQAINKLWVSAWYIGVPSNMSVVAVGKLNHELKSIFLENKNGMGSAVSYVVAKTLLVTPIFVCFAFAALGIPGFVIQAFPISTFAHFILLWTVQILIWECSAEAFAGIFDDEIAGMLVQTGIWFAALLFSGFLVTVGDMFWPLKLFYYILPYNYYIRSAMYLIFTKSTWVPCTDPTTSVVCVDSSNGVDVLNSLSFVFPLVTTENTFWSDIGYMLLMGLFWKIIGVSVIVVRSCRVARIRDEMTNTKGGKETGEKTIPSSGRPDDELNNEYESESEVDC